MLKLFGTNYLSGRFLAMACSFLVGIVIFLLARKLFDRQVAILASALYLMLPLELAQSVIVKMQPLANLITCLALLAVVKFSESRDDRWLFVAGVLAGAGYYVRPSALIIPATVLAFLVLFHGKRLVESARHFGFFVCGYVLVIVSMLGYYSKFMSPDVLLASQTPFGFLKWAVKEMPSLYGPSVESMDTVSTDAYAVYSRFSSYYLDHAFYFHSFLLIGLACSILEYGYRLVTRDSVSIKGYIVSHSLLYLWLCSLFIAYGFYFYIRVFFIDYSREFLPPLLIVFSAWLLHSVPALKREGVLERCIVGGLCLAAVVFFVQARYEQLFWKGHHASLAVALITLFTFTHVFRSVVRRSAFVIVLSIIIVFIVISQQVPYLFFSVPSTVVIAAIYCLTWILLWKRDQPALADYGRFVCVSMALAALAVSVSFSATLLGLPYDGVWSPNSVRIIAADLKAHTSHHDEVMSGAVIWELQASRKPFQLITHPLQFQGGMSPIQQAVIERAVQARPPKVIILDGFTEQTYFRAPLLRELLNAKYQFVTLGEPSVFGEPVKLYRLKEGPANDAAVFLESGAPRSNTHQRNAKAAAGEPVLGSNTDAPMGAEAYTY
jgi:4-amino-4-deoxy-L-arabinose transferase-like glycosyltransferase